MRVYRLSKGLYKNDLSGRGAELAGGRWNSKGTALLYTCESRALCTTEIAVHTPLGIVPSDYWLITLEIPDALPFLEFERTLLPPDWKTFPHPNATQLLGDTFAREGKFVAAKVPSAVVQGDHNYLLNPRHPEFRQVQLVASEPFPFDERLFVK
ncbi:MULTISPECIES: RES family NAD+ phosphorylase [Rufibacter]|uniref:RES domain-containing protein n=1 Tax=Rufibacter quisquiliarum TaxID=1549639 RepID=A0A839GNR6_9BACT|nr:MULTISPECIES: RES family NAD+ phosphorylase [Rufibacter]MBA9079593.1 RES domain-containing protein [Rufibacter quisquiliarum]